MARFLAGAAAAALALAMVMVFLWPTLFEDALQRWRGWWQPPPELEIALGMQPRWDARLGTCVFENTVQLANVDERQLIVEDLEMQVAWLDEMPAVDGERPTIVEFAPTPEALARLQGESLLQDAFAPGRTLAERFTLFPWPGPVAAFYLEVRAMVRIAGADGPPKRVEALTWVPSCEAPGLDRPAETRAPDPQLLPRA